jgi:hypothetical protein
MTAIALENPSRNRILTIGSENDRYPNRPSSYFQQFYFALIEYWLKPRPAMIEVDSVIEHVLHLIALEVTEIQEELDEDTIKLPLLAKEEADVLVLSMALFINNITRHTGEIPDFEKIERYTNGQARTVDIYQQKMDSLTKPNQIDPDDEEALKAVLEQIYVLTGSLINHAVPFPAPDYMLFVIQEVLRKNIRNYPAEYFAATHWLSSEALSIEQMLQEYEHAVKALKLIRKHTGNNTAGLRREYHRPYRMLIHDFENSEAALTQLEAHLVEGHLDAVTGAVKERRYNESLLTVKPTYRNTSELVVVANARQTKLIFDAQQRYRAA